MTTGTPYHQAPWRTGRKVHRTVYATQHDRQARDGDPLIGMMDTPEVAREAVAAHNTRLTNEDKTRARIRHAASGYSRTL